MLDQTEAQLLRYAEAITDESPVAWAESGVLHPDLADDIAYLAQLETIAGVFRESRERTATAEAGVDTVVLEFPSVEPLLFVWGHLRAHELLGAGTFGEVYRASDPTLDREVALKLKRPATADASSSDRRFLEEARRMARVRHPNVQTVYGADVFDGRAGLWSDLVRGTTLEDQLQQQGPLSAVEAANIGLDLCRALAAVHAAGLIHGDVKTSNVMRETGGRILLVDFGAGCEILPRGSDVTGLPAYGTPLSMAPEILDGAAPHPGADIYALGVLLYRLVTGRYPIIADTFAELRDRLRAREIVHLRDVRADLPGGFVHVVERAMAADPAVRYASAGSMERALASLATMAPIEHAAPAAVPVKPARRTQLWLALAAIVVLAVVVRFVWPMLNDSRNAGAVQSTRASATSTPAAPAARPLAVDATLYRLTTKGGHDTLGAVTHVRRNDQVGLSIASPESVWLYVLSEDERGERNQLFPDAARGDLNPLVPGRRYMLPHGTDSTDGAWGFTDSGRTTNMLVVCSRSRLTTIEPQLAEFSQTRLHTRSQQRETSASGEPVSLRGLGWIEQVPKVPAARDRHMTRVEESLENATHTGAVQPRDLQQWHYTLTIGSR